MNATRDHKVQIAIGDSRDVAGPFDFIRLQTSTGPLIIDINGLQTGLVAGQAIRFKKDPVKEFVIRNDSGALVTATFKLGYLAEVEDTNLSGTVSQTKAITLGDAADFTVVQGAAAAVALAANAARRTAIIKALSTNSQSVRLGNAPAAGRGYELTPGESVYWDVTAAIKAWTAAGADQYLSITEVDD